MDRDDERVLDRLRRRSSLLSAQELASVCNIPIRTVYDAASKGKLRVTRHPIRIEPVDAYEWRLATANFSPTCVPVTVPNVGALSSKVSRPKPSSINTIRVGTATTARSRGVEHARNVTYAESGNVRGLPIHRTPITLIQWVESGDSIPLNLYAYERGTAKITVVDQPD